MKKILLVIGLFLFSSCSLPNEGEIVENKLTQERYEIYRKGNCDELLEYLNKVREEHLIKVDSDYYDNSLITFRNYDEVDPYEECILIETVGEEERLLGQTYTNTLYIIIDPSIFKRKYKLVR